MGLAHQFLCLHGLLTQQEAPAVARGSRLYLPVSKGSYREHSFLLTYITCDKM